MGDRISSLAASAAALCAAVAAGGAAAQTPPRTEVSVTTGPLLQRHMSDLGARAVSDAEADLRDAVRGALKRDPNPPARVDLVLEDAVPNRPTFDQLGRTPGLSYDSIGLGGARVSGTVTYADGRQVPLKEQFFETDLSNDRGADVWFDANRAFDRVAHDIATGRIPDRFQGPGPTGVGHFGLGLYGQE